MNKATENYYTECIVCCELEDGGSACCCESTSHQPDSLRHALVSSSIEDNKVELVFRTIDAADRFDLKLLLNEYKK